MSPTPAPSTPSPLSATGQSPDPQYRVVRKRNRVPLSCGPCRHRKLRCNRAHPCENCIKRGDAASCSYAAPSARKRNQSSPGSSNSDEMQSRIDRLEGLVLSLMTHGVQSTGPAAAVAALEENSGPDSADAENSGPDDEGMITGEADGDARELDRVTNSLGILKVDATKTMYFGESHWTAMLNEISDLKNFFKEHKKQIDEQFQKVAASKGQECINGEPFMFSTAPPPDRAEILAALPSRHVVDRLIARYFNSSDPAIHIIHGPSFHRDYEAHWQDPVATPIVWLAQLFAIMRLAMQSYHRAGDEPVEYQGQSLQMANTYRHRTIDCLLRAEFCKAKPPMLETLILHLQGEHKNSAEVGSWVMGAMIVRLAMRMGYHRDPKSFPDIRPFHGELRRRVWTFVRMVDVLLSFQLGMPGMIRPKDCDTTLPRNLYDEEIDESSEKLPMSRPISEPTQVSYMIAKAQLTFVFGDVVDMTNSLHSCSYDEVMALDHRLREARDSIPLHLRSRSMDGSRMDPATLIIQRFSLELLYHKSQCVLHKKFLGRARTSPRYAHSRRTCVDSSLELLRNQALIHRETLPHGRPRSVKWFMSSVTSPDFLLAAMIVCLDLHYGSQSKTADQSSNDMLTWGLERHAEMIQALETANVIWKEFLGQSVDAYKANELLTVMLEKLKKASTDNAAAKSTSALPGSQSVGAGSTARVGRVARFGQEQPEHTAAMTLGLMSSGGVAQNSTASFERGSSPTPAPAVPSSGRIGLTPPHEPGRTAPAANDPTMSLFTMLGQHGNMVDMPANFEWDAWDSYIQGTGLDAANQIWPLDMDIPPPTAASAVIQSPTDPRIAEAQRQAALAAGGVGVGVGAPIGSSQPPGQSQAPAQSQSSLSFSQHPTLEQLLDSKTNPERQQQQQQQQQQQRQRQRQRQRQQPDAYPNIGGLFMGTNTPLDHNRM